MEEPNSVQALKNKIGAEGEPCIVEIEKSILKRFAEATEDANPLSQDMEYAKKSKYGGIIVPPGFFCTSMISGVAAKRPVVPWPFKRGVDGGGEWEIYQVVRLGDIITSVTKLIDVYDREGRGGKTYFVVFETTHKNQRKEIVGKSRSTAIEYL